VSARGPATFRDRCKILTRAWFFLLPVFANALTTMMLLSSVLPRCQRLLSSRLFANSCSPSKSSDGPLGYACFIALDLCHSVPVLDASFTCLLIVCHRSPGLRPSLPSILTLPSNVRIDARPWEYNVQPDHRASEYALVSFDGSSSNCGLRKPGTAVPLACRIKYE
jgi:hypothetical protein